MNTKVMENQLMPNIKYHKSYISLVSAIYIIDTLSPKDLQTGRSKYETILDELSSTFFFKEKIDPNPIRHLKCGTLAELHTSFEEIGDACNSKFYPLMFLDGHGDKNSGLILSSGENLDWNNLNHQLELISRAAGGQFTVVASLCHSNTAVQNISYGKPPPAPFYYGYSDEVTAGQIEDEGTKLIQEFLRTGQFNKEGKLVELYSEYDHTLPSIKQVLETFPLIAENKISKNTLSKKKIRQHIAMEIGKTEKKTKGLNKIINQVMDCQKIIPEIIKQQMYATERRDLFIKQITEGLRNNIDI